MHYRNKNNPDNLSILGFGCMRFPKKGNGFDHEEIERELKYAVDNGVNYFDTAYIYPGNEEELGRALKNTGYRDRIKLASKMPHYLMKSVEEAEKKFGEQLLRLRTDHIDYYLMHMLPDAKTWEALRARGIDKWLEEKKEKGQIRRIGYSFHGSSEMFIRILNAYDWDFAQIQHNYLDWNHASGRNVNSSYLYGELAARDIPMTVMEPLRGGALANVPESVSAKMLARAPGKSIASWAFRYAGSQPKILSVLSGMTYMEHLQDNIATYSDFTPCTEEELEFLERIAIEMTEFPLIECTACNYCLPCKYGIDIPGIFMHYNKCIREDLMPMSSGDKNYRKLRRAFLVGMDRSVNPLHQASHCIGCADCIPKCPQTINIPLLLQQIDRFTENLKQNKEF